MILFTMMRETRRVTISQTGYEKRKKMIMKKKKQKYTKSDAKSKRKLELEITHAIQR